MFGFLRNKQKAIEKRLSQLDSTDLAVWLRATQHIEKLGQRAVGPLCDILLGDLDAKRSASVVATDDNTESEEWSREMFEKASKGIAAGTGAFVKDCILQKGIYAGNGATADNVKARLAIIAPRRSCRSVYATYVFVGCPVLPEIVEKRKVLWVQGDPVNIIAYGCNRQYGILQCLINLGSPKALPTLIQAAEADDEWIRQYAFQAINTIGAAPCISDLVRLFETSHHEDVQGYCISLLDQLESAEARAALESMHQKAKNDKQRDAISKALGDEFVSRRDQAILKEAQGSMDGSEQGYAQAEAAYRRLAEGGETKEGRAKGYEGMAKVHEVRKEQDKNEEMRAHSAQGKAAELRGNLEQAKGHYKKAVEVEGVSAEDEREQVLQALAQVIHDQGDHEEEHRTLAMQREKLANRYEEKANQHEEAALKHEEEVEKAKRELNKINKQLEEFSSDEVMEQEPAERRKAVTEARKEWRILEKRITENDTKAAEEREAEEKARDKEAQELLLATQRYENVLKFNTNDHESRLALGRAYARLGEHVKAVQAHTQVIRRQKNEGAEETKQAFAEIEELTAGLDVETEDARETLAQIAGIGESNERLAQITLMVAGRMAGHQEEIVKAVQDKVKAKVDEDIQRPHEELAVMVEGFKAAQKQVTAQDSFEVQMTSEKTVTVNVVKAREYIAWKYAEESKYQEALEQYVKIMDTEGLSPVDFFLNCKQLSEVLYQLKEQEAQRPPTPELKSLIEEIEAKVQQVEGDSQRAELALARQAMGVALTDEEQDLAPVKEVKEQADALKPFVDRIEEKVEDITTVRQAEELLHRLIRGVEVTVAVKDLQKLLGVEQEEDAGKVVEQLRQASVLDRAGQEGNWTLHRDLAAFKRAQDRAVEVLAKKRRIAEQQAAVLLQRSLEDEGASEQFQKDAPKVLDNYGTYLSNEDLRDANRLLLLERTLDLLFQQAAIDDKERGSPRISDIEDKVQNLPDTFPEPFRKILTAVVAQLSEDRLGWSELAPAQKQELLQRTYNREQKTYENLLPEDASSVLRDIVSALAEKWTDKDTDWATLTSWEKRELILNLAPFAQALNIPEKEQERELAALEAEAYEADIARFGKEVGYLVGLADAQVRLGEVNKAKENCEEALKDDPKLAKGHYVMGLIYKEEGEPDKAIESLKKAVDADATFKDGWVALAELYREERWLLKAAKAYESLAGIYYGEEDYTEAESCYKRALELRADLADEINPEYAKVFETQGGQYVTLAAQAHRDVKAKLYKKAQKFFEQAAKLNPYSAIAHSGLAECAVNIKDTRRERTVSSWREQTLHWEKALESAQKAIDKKRDHARAYYLLGHIYSRTKKELGSDVFTGLKKGKAASFFDVFTREVVNARAAKKHLKKAIQLDENHYDAYKDLGEFYAGAGSFGKAALAYWNMARAYKKANQWVDTLVCLEKAYHYALGAQRKKDMAKDIKKELKEADEVLCYRVWENQTPKESI